MSKLPWKAWHEVVRLRDDLKSGELSLSIFAADLYRVVLDEGPEVYRDPREFFALTYPTFNLRQLARDVVNRLAGKNDKAVRQLALTYGGGKTHTLVTLRHLVNDPAALPDDIPAVREFIEHIGMTPPRARVAVLPFDKLDVERGMEAIAPGGERRWLKHPWSVLAFQIAGADGLRLLHAEGADAERESAPAENLLTDLLALPGREGLATLVLIDEVLMYAREKIGLDPAWRSRLVNFFQYLTQAATKVDRCAIVASLLATDPAKSDELGKEIIHDIHTIFRREREEEVQPVVKEDVAEVLRRRFFTVDSIRDREAFRPHVVAALKGIVELDDQTRRDGQGAESVYLASYPFHPELTDVLYGKWTNLEGFQRTRGILRTFALALRDAVRWDRSPLIAANVFLNEPGKPEISEAARELASVAAAEEYEGKRHEWPAILEGELAKARDIQDEVGGLRHREIEQAVFATFLHSQPATQKALTRDLLLLLGHVRPDRIELEKGLRRWTEVSWFLDEGAISEAQTGSDGKKQIPSAWRLGSKPNLRQMHHDACTRVRGELIEAKLLDEIGRARSLTAGASGAGARVHLLPERPRDIEDDGEFHFAVLGPKAASDPAKPSAEARRFIDETTAPDRPRVYRNAIVVVVPSHDGVESVRARIREYLGWEEVHGQLKAQALDPLRAEVLRAHIDEAKRKIPEAIQQAYSIVVTVSEKNEVQCFKITTGSDSLFALVKGDSRSRIQDTAISAEALLPGGPYDLWREGETARRVKDLVGAFAAFTHLPKMLNAKAILDTVLQGCLAGDFVLRAVRPDRSVRTFWRQAPSLTELADPATEVVLPESAELTELAPELLALDVLPALWQGDSLSIASVREYFAGGKVVSVPKGGYEEPATIPKAAPEVVEAAVRSAVASGKLWLLSGPASLWKEEIPAGVINDATELRTAPAPIGAAELLPESLPSGWSGGRASALSLATALAQKAGRLLPWPLVRDALGGALHAGYLELDVDSASWPCEAHGAAAVRVRGRKASPLPPPPKRDGVLVAEAELGTGELQDLADQIAAIAAVAVGYDLKLRVRIEVGGGKSLPAEVNARLNELLAEVSEDLVLG